MEAIITTNKVGDLEYLKPIVKERKVRSLMNVLIAILGCLFVVMIELFAVYILGFEFVEATILGAILVLVYAISLPFLLEPVRVKEVRMTAVRTVEKPVVNEIVDKPVVRTITKKVVKYKEKKRKTPVAKKRK